MLKYFWLLILFCGINTQAQNRNGLSDKNTSVESEKKREAVSVFDFGAKGDGNTDDTPAIQKAINSGRPITFGVGVFLVKSLKLPYSFKGLSIQGAGFNHWTKDAGTVLKAISESPILTAENGCDFVKITGLRFEGNNLSSTGIDGAFGAAFNLENVGFYNFTEFGFKSSQGLCRVRACFFGNNKIGFQMFSDSTFTDSEITGGEVALKIVAGGNRVNNVWLNGVTEHSILLQPYDNETNHQNTSLANLYVEDVLGKGIAKDILLIQGSADRRVQQVRISNCFFSHTISTENSNTILRIENADEIIISENNILGQHTYATSKTYTKNFIAANNSNNLKVANNIVKGINMSPIVLLNSFDVSIIGNDFIDCAGRQEDAIIQLVSRGNSLRTFITSNRFIDYRKYSTTYALQTDHDSGFVFQNNFIQYPNSAVVKDFAKMEIKTSNNFR